MIELTKLVRPAALGAALLLVGSAAFAQDAPKPAAGDKPAKQGKLEPGRENFGREFRRQSFRGKRGARGFRSMLRGFRQLDLTDAQKEQIKTLMDSHRAANQPLREEMRTLMAKRRDGTFTDADKARVGEIRSSMRESGDQLRNTILGLLTPEQTQKLEQMKAERQKRMEERRQRFLEQREKRKERMNSKEKPAAPVVKQP